MGEKSQQPARSNYDRPVPTNLILQSGGEVVAVAGWSDEIVERLDEARANGQRWIWFERDRPEQPTYGERQTEPVAIMVDGVVGVAGLKASDASP
jgi:hypothetical protein